MQKAWIGLVVLLNFTVDDSQFIETNRDVGSWRRSSEKSKTTVALVEW